MKPSSVLFEELELSGAFLVDLERIEDDRGFFARAFCADEMAARGLATTFVQSNISYNRRRGTLRGLHYQAPPHEEAKLVRCIRGAIFDVIVDLRAGSPTLHRSHAVELSAANRRALYVPPGFAHGFQSLTDDAEVLYLMSAAYQPEAARGVRYDDPALAIAWPLPPTAISDKDRALPRLDG